MFEAHEENDRSPFWDWLPITVGLLAALIVALAFCPVPRSEKVSGPIALFLAVAYVAMTTAVAAGALSVCGALVAKHRGGVPARRPLALSCSVASWLGPMVAFYQRDSLWAALTACVVGAFCAALIHRHHFAAGARGILAASPEAPETSESRRPFSLKFAAILLQSAALLVVASMARPAAVLVGSAAFIISLFYQAAVFPNPVRSRYQKSSHTLLAIALAMFFVAASLTPYLAVQKEDERSDEIGARTKFSMSRASHRSEASQTGVLQYVQSLFHEPGREHARREGDPAKGDEPSTVTPYPVLQALFGEQKSASESQSNSGEKKRKYRTSTSLVADESYPGMILRPLIEEHSPIVPPVPRRRILEENSPNWKHDPVSIPFYGAYWYFRASDGTLPPDSIESRGDPASMSFKTTDFTPIAMEARQSFGALIDLSCCRSVELVISNGDRRPATVAVELILTDTRLPGKPEQSLGICAVNSSQRWSPEDNRPPVTETLNFRVPPHPAIRSFDEAIIRFEMGSPRERWSAKIAILKFRLIPQVL